MRKIPLLVLTMLDDEEGGQYIDKGVEEDAAKLTFRLVSLEVTILASP